MFWSGVRRFAVGSIKAGFVVCGLSLFPAKGHAGLLDFITGKAKQPAASDSEVRLLSEDTKAPADFVVPNEFDNYLHFRELKIAQDGQARAVISVGTFRAFNLAGYMERDYLLCLDYAPGIAEFNTALAKLIDRHDRRELLRLLLADSVPVTVQEGQSEREVVRARLAEREASGELERAFLDARTDDPYLRLIYDHFSRVKSEKPVWRAWLKAMIQFTSSQERYEATIFGSNRAYEHVRKIIRSGRFHALTGSLSGEKTLQTISSYLKSRRAVVSELDVSNALEHVERAQRDFGMKAFVRNVQALPMAKDGKVLVTVDTRFMSLSEKLSFPAIGTWHYSVFDPGKLLPNLSSAKNDQDLAQAFLKTGLSLSPNARACEGLFKSR